MDEILSYLGESYPRVRAYNGYEQAVEQLNALIAEHGVTVTRKMMRDAGITPVPSVVMLAGTNQYTFARCACRAYIDWEEAYVDSQSYNYESVAGHYFTGIFRNSLKCFVSDRGNIYDGAFIAMWIEYGEICDECGAAFLDTEETHTCEACSANYKLLEYNAKAEDLLGMEETNETLFGIELEYEDLTPKQVAGSLKGHAISKRDGSLSNKGCEVVTRPACIQTHKAKLKAFYDTVKVAAASNTGMHVHVDRSKLTNFQIGFMMEFLNKETLIPNIEIVAGRSYSTNTYCKADRSLKMSWGNSFDEGSYKLSRRPTGKYSPLNTAKPHTVEFRIFSSPESLLECSAKLDFVAALVKYSSPYAISVKSLKDKFNWDMFLSFVTVHKREFPDFVAYFMKKEA
jgi:hypothetical protein